MSSHRQKMSQDDIDRVVMVLAERLHSHYYFIGRKEAKNDLGIRTIIDPVVGIESWMREAYDDLNNYMSFGKPFNPEEELGAIALKNVAFPVALIQSEKLVSTFFTTIELQRVQVLDAVPSGTPVTRNQINWRITHQGWK